MDPLYTPISAQAAAQTPYTRYSPPPGPPAPAPEYSWSPTRSPGRSPAQKSYEMSDKQSPQSTTSHVPVIQQDWNQGRPAPWQLGSHAQYGFYNAQAQYTSNEASEPAQTTYGWSKEQDEEGNSVERVRIVNYASLSEPEDVELTLHRGLQARQVWPYRQPHAQY